MIEKAVKQLLHVYPFLTPDILMFSKSPITQLKTDSPAGTSKSRAFSRSKSRARRARWTST